MNKKMAKILISMILIIVIFISNVYALSSKQASKIENGQKLKVTKNSYEYTMKADYNVGLADMASGNIYSAEKKGDKFFALKGDTVYVEGKQKTVNGTWYIKIKNKDGKVGFVHSANLSKYSEKIAEDDIKKFIDNYNPAEIGRFPEEDARKVFQRGTELLKETDNQQVKNIVEAAKNRIESLGGKTDPNGTVTTSDGTTYYPEDTTDNTSIYRAPTRNSDVDSSESSIEDLFSDADDFVDSGSSDEGVVGVVNNNSLQNFSKTFYNIFLEVGIAVAVIAGIIIGIKFMTGSVDEKANIKQLLVPYIVGCIVVFGAFGIWALVVNLLQDI